MARTRSTETRLRDAKAVELKRGGLNYPQIARELGYKSVSSAFDAVKRGLRDFYKEDREDAITIERERLNTALRVAMRIMLGTHAAYSTTTGIAVTYTNAAGQVVPVADVGPNLAAAKLVRELSESLRKLDGLDAPARRRIEIITEDAVDATMAGLDAEYRGLMQELAGLDSAADPGAA